MKKPVIVITVLGIIAIFAVAGAILTSNKSNRTGTQRLAQPIPDQSYFNDVKKLSVGKKPSCLTDVPSAKNAVQNYEPSNIMDSLDMVLGTRIIDMPAGQYESTVNSFSKFEAKGTVAFVDKNQQATVGSLKNFNYIAKVNPDNSHWKLVLLIACD